MATAQRSFAENAPGSFFVDDTCIDCDLCRQIAPSTFVECDDHAIVQRQPESTQDVLRAAMALAPQEPVIFGSSVADNIRFGAPGASEKSARCAATAAGVSERSV